MKPTVPPEKVILAPPFAALLTHIGFTPTWVFTSEKIIPWRKLPDRENCTFDATWPDGRPAHLHIKRYPPPHASQAADEAHALSLLTNANIPSPPLVAWGRLSDGRGFLITADLTDFTAADKLIAAGLPFDKISAPTAHLAARLHTAGLHHRDLYLCHFFLNPATTPPEINLIDAARVRPLPAWPLRQRWIVKDLAQFWYSMTQLPIPEPDRHRWLAHYTDLTHFSSPRSLLRAIESKASQIAAHDIKLNQRQPKRNISIPKT